jgi:hypothetical protein
MRVRQRAAHLLRAVAFLARDERIPRPLRFLLLLGVAPIPGPVDEVVLLLVSPVLAIFYRAQLRDAWERTARVDTGGSAPSALIDP